MTIPRNAMDDLIDSIEITDEEPQAPSPSEAGFGSMSKPEPKPAAKPKVEVEEGHRKAIVQMFANGSSIPDLAKWYKLSQAEIREVLRPYVKYDRS
jgi:hypothetical protein